MTNVGDSCTVTQYFLFNVESPIVLILAFLMDLSRWIRKNRLTLCVISGTCYWFYNQFRIILTVRVVFLLAVGLTFIQAATFEEIGCWANHMRQLYLHPIAETLDC